MGAEGFVIRKRGTLEFFVGFGTDQEPVFADQSKAVQFPDRLMARAQATLLSLTDCSVQLKPEATCKESLQVGGTVKQSLTVAGAEAR